jgi:outer membrane lipoprotein-sorting protein
VKGTRTICQGLLSILCASAAFGEERISAEQMLAQLDRVRLPNRSFSADLAVTEFRGGNRERELTLRMYTRRSASGFDSLFVCLAPAIDRNKLLLAKGEKLWFYDPRSVRSVPVSPFQFRNHAFVLDALSSALSLGYSAEVGADETIVDLANRQFRTRVLKLTPRESRRGGAATIRYWLEKETRRPIKSEVSSASGKLLRTIYYSDFKNVLGESRPMRIVVLNAVERSVSEIKLSAFSYRETSDSFFDETLMPSVSVQETEVIRQKTGKP